MDEFLERHKLPELTQEAHMNRSITSKEIESLIKKVPTKESTDLDGFTGILTPVFHKLFQKMLGNTQTHYETSTILIPNLSETSQ